MAVTTTQTMGVIDNRSFLKRYRSPIIALDVVLVIVAAALVWSQSEQPFLLIAQIFLLANIAGIVALTLSSKTIRQARRWHGVDWWLAMISSVVLCMFFVIAIIPEYLSPYKYNDYLGPGLGHLAPLQTPPDYILITRNDLPFENLEDIGYDINTGEKIVRDSLAYGVGSVDSQGGEIISYERDRLDISLDRTRFPDDITVEGSLDLLEASDLSGRRPLVALIGSKDDYESLLKEYPNLRVVGPARPSYPNGFLLGTNILGQDLFSHIIYGTRTTLVIGILSALFAATIGIPLGLVSGYIGGWLDRLMATVMDSIYSFPSLILAIAIATVLGRGVMTVIAAIGVVYVPTYYRIVRSQSLAIKEASFVEAARSLGARNRTILGRYIFPNVFASVVVIFSINIADAVLTGAALAFLSLGLPETTADWGVDLVKGQEQFLAGEWWLVTFPGLFIMLLTLCFSMLGESLSEILNPRLNRS